MDETLRGYSNVWGHFEEIGNKWKSRTEVLAWHNTQFIEQKNEPQNLEKQNKVDLSIIGVSNFVYDLLKFVQKVTRWSRVLLTRRRVTNNNKTRDSQEKHLEDSEFQCTRKCCLLNED